MKLCLRCHFVAIRYASTLRTRPAETATSKKKKTLSVAVVGAPNMGKSLLCNQLTKAAACAVSCKMDTTTRNMDVFITEENVQLRIIDSPGTVGRGHVKDVMKKKKDDDAVLCDPERAIERAQHVLVVQDATAPGDYIHHRVMHMLHRHRHVPSSLVMNKIDLISDRTELLELTRILTNGTVGDARIKTAATTIGRLGANTNVEMPLHNEGIENQDERWQTRYRDLISKPTHKVNYMDTKRLFINIRGWPHFQAVFFVSSLTGEGVEPLRDYLKKISEEGEWRTGSQEVTTRDPKDICCDSIRAAMLDTVYGEVPYLAKIKINEWIEEGEVLQVVAEIHLDKDRDAKHLMGPGGHRMAQIGERVNQHLHTLFRRQLFVRILVKSRGKVVDVKI